MLMSRLSSFWRNLVHRGRVERDLDDEIHSVFALLVDEKTRAGMHPADARRAATLELGGMESLKEQVRHARAGAFVDALLKDIRYGARSLRRTPGFTIAAVITLALGIGANTSIFTLLDAVILKPLPVPAPNELVTLYENATDGAPDAAGGSGRYQRFSYPRFQRLEQALESQGSLAASTRSARLAVRLPGSAQAISAQGQLVSGGYFATLGVSAARGRLLTPAGVRTDQAGPVAVISDGFWKRALGAADAAIGQTVVVNGVNVTVAGIAPPGFVGMWTDAEADLWLPLTLQPALGYQTNSSSYDSAARSRPWVTQDSIAWLNIIGRVREADLPRARTRLEAANRQGLLELAGSWVDAQDRREMLAHTLAVEPFARGFSGVRARFSAALFALSAMVAIVLLVTCANIANLLLTRAAGRARDMGIRISLGATTARLIQQCLTESLMLGLLGGAAGMLAGNWASGFLAREVLGTQGDLPLVFSPDARVMIFATGLSLVTALLVGLAPALRAIRVARVASLATNQRQSIGQAAMKGMRPLVAAQLALSVVVACAAVLLGRTLINYSRLDLGFTADHLVTVSFAPGDSGYTRDQMPALGQRLVTAARSVSGVKSAAVSTCGLVANCSYRSGFRIEGSGEGIKLNDNWVGPGYFATVGIPLVSGREFDERDTARSPRVAIITESVARRYFPNQNPIGRRLGFNQLDTEIVGVVCDARSLTVHEPPVSMVYFPIEQPAAFRTYPGNLDVRVAGDAGRAAIAVREAIRRAEPRLLVDNAAAMSARIERDVSRERLVAFLATAFAALTLFLSSVGLYGVLSYAVAGRTQEIGVRMALGARPGEVAGLVVRDALKTVVVGVFAGVVAALGTGRLLESLLFDVEVSDPVTYTLVLAVLAAVTVAAAYLPVRRAARVDPMLALRSE